MGDEADWTKRGSYGHGASGPVDQARPAGADNHPLDRERAEALSDIALLAAYEQTNGEVGDSWADALAYEIDRRGLDV